MQVHKFRHAICFGVIVLMATLTICLAQRDILAAAEKPITIGVVSAVSGVYYVHTQPYINGVNLAVKEVNASGGILGRPVEIILRDDEGKVDIGVREMKYLVLSKKADVVFGGPSSNVVLAVSEVAKQYKTPYITPLGNSKTIIEDKGHRYVFQIVPNTRMEGAAAAVFTAKNGWKNIWTLNQDYEYGQTITKIYLEKLKQLVPDMKVVGQSWPRLGETDFTPYINPIVAAKPDFVFSSTGGSDLINFTKQAKAYGFFEKVHASGLYDMALIGAIGQDMVEGAIGINRGEFYSINTPEVLAFMEKFRNAFGGMYPTAYSIFGYEMVYNVKQAMEKAKSTNKEKVVDALAGMEFTGPGGKRYYRACDHQANGSIYVGFTTKTPDYPFYVLKDVLKVPGEETWLSCEQVKALQGKK